MSLLNAGRDEITVYPAVPADDGYGGTMPAAGDPVRVRALVMPAETDEDAETGYLTGTVYQVYARSLPAGPWSRVEWAGAVWAVVGEVQRFTGSRRVAFEVATIRKRT